MALRKLFHEVFGMVAIGTMVAKRREYRRIPPRVPGGQIGYGPWSHLPSQCVAWALVVQLGVLAVSFAPIGPASILV